MPSKKTHVFVSYSHADALLVGPVVQLLRVNASLVFQDLDSIRPGKKWREEIATGLVQSSLVVIFWCAHANRSEEVAAEWRSAIKLKKDLLPLLLDATPLPNELRVFQRIDFRATVGASHDNLSLLSEKLRGAVKRSYGPGVLVRRSRTASPPPISAHRRPVPRWVVGAIAVASMAAIAVVAYFRSLPSLFSINSIDPIPVPPPIIVNPWLSDGIILLGFTALLVTVIGSILWFSHRTTKGKRLDGDDGTHTATGEVLREKYSQREVLPEVQAASTVAHQLAREIETEIIRRVDSKDKILP